MPDQTWRDAITNVLRDTKEAMHYTDIAEAIAERSLRTELGATPASTVSSVITTAINNEGANSPFIRVSRGLYALRRQDEAGQQAAQAAPEAPVNAADEEVEETGLIKCPVCERHLFSFAGARHAGGT